MSGWRTFVGFGFGLLILFFVGLGFGKGTANAQELELTTNETTTNSTPADECSYCQRVLFMSFVWFQRTGNSSRLLRHKLKHICKRYYEYKRHCLLTLMPKLDTIGDGMRAALVTHRYKPITTCKFLKECNKDQSPLDAEEMAELRASASNITLPPILSNSSSFGF